MPPLPVKPGADGLKFFLARSQALGLYRQFLREVRGVQQPARGAAAAWAGASLRSGKSQIAGDQIVRRRAGELLDEIRRNFRVSASVREPNQLKFLLSDGKLRLKQLRDMLGLQR